MNVMQTKDEDATLKPEEEDEEGEDDDEYAVRFGSHNTTLRKAAAYALTSFAELFPELVFQTLQT